MPAQSLPRCSQRAVLAGQHLRHLLDDGARVVGHHTSSPSAIGAPPRALLARARSGSTLTAPRPAMPAWRACGRRPDSAPLPRGDRPQVKTAFGKHEQGSAQAPPAAGDAGAGKRPPSVKRAAGRSPHAGHRRRRLSSRRGGRRRQWRHRQCGQRGGARAAACGGGRRRGCAMFVGPRPGRHSHAHRDRRSHTFLLCAPRLCLTCVARFFL